MAYNYNGQSERVRPVIWIEDSAQVPHPPLARRFCVSFNDSFFYDILTVKTAFYLMVFITRPSPPRSQAMPYAWLHLRQRVFPSAPRFLYRSSQGVLTPSRLVRECSREDVILTHHAGRVTLDIEHNTSTSASLGRRDRST